MIVFLVGGDSKLKWITRKFNINSVGLYLDNDRLLAVFDDLPFQGHFHESLAEGSVEHGWCNLIMRRESQHEVPVALSTRNTNVTLSIAHCTNDG